MKELKLDFSPKFSRRMSFFSKKAISGTFSSTGGQFGMAAGEKRQQFYRGKGLTFDGFREYTPNDDARMIDWKATLRANKKLVRKFSEEQNKNIVFFFDVSETMCYSSHTKLKVEYAAELISSMAFSYLQTGDSVGLVMFSDGLKWRRNLSVGEGQWVNICQDMLRLENYGGQFEFTKSAEELIGYLGTQAVIVIVSDLIGLENDSDWYSVFEIMAAQFEIIMLVIRDPLDNYIPKGLGNVYLNSPYENAKAIVDLNDIRGNYNEYNIRMMDSLKEFAEKLGADFQMLETDKDFVKPMLNFLRWREETWR
jgi:uncharacterized protein (DUF58 family)